MSGETAGMSGDTVVRMPKLADTLVEGTVGKWLKQVGESVAAGEPLVSIETDKVTTEVSAPAAGAVLELLVPEGQTVAVDTPIARLGQLDGTIVTPSVTPGSNGSRDAQVDGTSVTSSGDGVAPRSVGSRDALAGKPDAPGTKVTPMAARLLAEHGLSAAQFEAGRRITKSDVLALLSSRQTQAPAPQQRTAAPPAPPPQQQQKPTPTQQAGLPHGDLQPLSSMRRAIAEHMARARQSIPHGQTVVRLDLTELAAWREQQKQRFEQEIQAPLTYTVLFVHALARALGQRSEPAHVGVAVALEQGLIVPVIKNAHELTLAQTAQAIADLAARARAGKLTPAETEKATMTVTNVGSFGNVLASPIVPLNQIGILGPGLVERKPMPAPDGGIRLGTQCYLTLMFDRRAFDDLAADRLLKSVAELLLELPEHAHSR